MKMEPLEIGNTVDNGGVEALKLTQHVAAGVGTNPIC